MFKRIMPMPGSGERPPQPVGDAAATIMGSSPERGEGAIVQPVVPEVKHAPSTEDVAKLAYERWLATGGSETENWLWAEAQLRATDR